MFYEEFSRQEQYQSGQMLPESGQSGHNGQNEAVPAPAGVAEAEGVDRQNPAWEDSNATGEPAASAEREVGGGEEEVIPTPTP